MSAEGTQKYRSPHQSELIITFYVNLCDLNLELVHSREDEGDGGDDDHGEADQGRYLRRPPRLGVLSHVPAEAS